MDRQLINYYPYVVREIAEYQGITHGEQPEFELAWDQTDRVMMNQFISTADELGISRYERLLGIRPMKEDTLESRRARIQAEWLKTIPYTYRVLVRMLDELYGAGNYEITPDFTNYGLTILVHLSLFGQVEELDKIISHFIPQNIYVQAANVLNYDIQGKVITGGVAVETRAFEVSSKLEKDRAMSAFVTYGGWVTDTKVKVINTKERVIDKEYNLTASILNGSTTTMTRTKTIN